MVLDPVGESYEAAGVVRVDVVFADFVGGCGEGLLPSFGVVAEDAVGEVEFILFVAFAEDVEDDGFRDD